MSDGYGSHYPAVMIETITAKISIRASEAVHMLRLP